MDMRQRKGQDMVSVAECTGTSKEEDCEVVTLEFDPDIAKTAQSIFDNECSSKVCNCIKLVQGCAKQRMREMLARGEQYDLIFLDADKEGYCAYYELAMGKTKTDNGDSSFSDDDEEEKGLLAPGGLLVADNSLCALLYDGTDERSQKLHDFNRLVANDDRVEQVCLTMREGITLVRRKHNVKVNGTEQCL